ncbi:MAG: rod shape-determining protein [Oscillospiraceae bacterium]|jgi:rod shape-determining protein MreB|nr:rod shape-determining protein [Oscillospiraceae bacterium]
MSVLSPDLGVDLGSASVVMYVAGRGIVLREPSLVIVRNDQSRECVAIGSEALEMLGRLPPDLVPVYPILQGVVADFEMTVLMIKYFLRLAIGVNRFGKPRAVVAIPAEVTEMERRAVEEAFRMAGFRYVHMVEAAVAAAHGSGLAVYEPQGNLVVDIGGGTTEVAVISMGSVVAGKSARQAGMAWDNAIVNYVKKKHNLLIGDRTAEQLKIDLGSAIPIPEARRTQVRGRDIVTGLPHTIELSSDEVFDALRDSAKQVLGLLTWTLERTPPELGADIMRNGIYLTGGSAQLPGMDQMLATELGLSVSTARNAMDCVALGCGYLATNIDLLGRIWRSHPLTE